LPGYRYANKNPARYEARHPIGTKARLAFDLLLYTGVRRSDAVRLGPQMERNGKLVFSEKKGRSRIVKTHELPILPPLRRSIYATQKQIGHLVYLVAASGQPQSAHAFGCWFIRRCREAGLARSAHGLRKLGAQRCAEAGASEHQLMALFGWANPSKRRSTPKRRAAPSSKPRRHRCCMHEAAMRREQTATRRRNETATKVSHFLRRRSPEADHHTSAARIAARRRVWLIRAIRRAA
jgi:integrase